MRFVITLLVFFSLSAFGVRPLDGSEKSFTEAFESLLNGDGHIAEEWDIEIGRLIKTHPTNFLKTLKIYRSRIKRIDALVGNFGPEWVDNFKKQKVEASLRIKALERTKRNTTDIEIKKIADECIKELRKY